MAEPGCFRPKPCRLVVSCCTTWVMVSARNAGQCRSSVGKAAWRLPGKVPILCAASAGRHHAHDPDTDHTDQDLLDWWEEQQLPEEDHPLVSQHLRQMVQTNSSAVAALDRWWIVRGVTTTNVARQEVFIDGRHRTPLRGQPVPETSQRRV
jgi:hypothetical protein